MEKRAIIAMALSVLVLLAWSALMPKPQPIAPQALMQQAAPVSVGTGSKPVPTGLTGQQAALEHSPAPAILFTYATPTMQVAFNETTAAIQDVLFKEYQSHKLVLENGFAILDNALMFKRDTSAAYPKFNVQSEINRVINVQFENTQSGNVQFEFAKKISKEFIFSNEKYEIKLRINVQSTSNQPVKTSLPIILGTLNFAPANPQARFQDIVAATEDKTSTLNGRKEIELSNMKFVALRDKYCAAIIQPEESGWRIWTRKVNNQETQVGINSPEFTLLPGQSVEKNFRIYLGPQDLQHLNQVNPQWAAIINYGMFDFIGQLLWSLLRFFFGLVHNWGWAIVILSLAVYLLLYPLTLKQMRSMRAMQAVQPRIEELRKTYKDNPQKLNKEIMELYREHKVNPFGGCLPLILQMPIFFALYQVLMRSVVLKGAQFLWIRDLAEPDRLFLLPSALPIIGKEINILPIVMAVAMFFQQKFSSAGSRGTGADSTAQQQKMMLIIFPIMFGFIFYRMPSGLVLYWFVNSMLMLSSQLVAARKK